MLSLFIVIPGLQNAAKPLMRTYEIGKERVDLRNKSDPGRTDMLDSLFALKAQHDDYTDKEILIESFEARYI